MLALALTRPRIAAIRRAVTAKEGGGFSGLHSWLHHPLLWISIQTRTAVALGIVFLMAVKPDLGGSLLTISVAARLGLASALAGLEGRRVQEDTPGSIS